MSASGKILKHAGDEQKIKKNKTVTWSLLDNDSSDLDSTGSDEDLTWNPSRSSSKTCRTKTQKGANRRKQTNQVRKKVEEMKKSLKRGPGYSALKGRVRTKQIAHQLDADGSTSVHGLCETTVCAASETTVCAASETTVCAASETTVCAASETTVCAASETTVCDSRETIACDASENTACDASENTACDASETTAGSTNNISVCSASETTLGSSRKTASVSKRKEQSAKSKLKNLKPKPKSNTFEQKNKLNQGSQSGSTVNSDINKQSDTLVTNTNLGVTKSKLNIKQDMVSEVNLDVASDEVVGIMSESDSEIDFEEVESVHFTPYTELRPDKAGVNSIIDENERTTTEGVVNKNRINSSKKNNENKEKGENSNTVENKKVNVRKDNSSSVKKTKDMQGDDCNPVKRKKTDARADNSNPVKRKKTDARGDNSNPVKRKKNDAKADNSNPVKKKKVDEQAENSVLGKKTMQPGNKTNQSDKVKRKKQNDDINEEKSKQSKSLQRKKQTDMKVEKSKRKNEANITKTSKTKKTYAILATPSGGSGKNPKRFRPSSKGNLTLDETDVTAVLLKMEGLSSEQLISVVQRGEDKGEDNSSAPSQTSESEDEDWEMVTDHNASLKSQIPDEPVEITISAPDFIKKRRKKKAFDWIDYVHRQIKRFRKDIQCDIHKVHLMCLVSWGMKQNVILNSEQIRAQALSLIPENLLQEPEFCNIRRLDTIVQWFRSEFTLDTEKQEKKTCTLIKMEDLEKGLLDRKVNSERLLVAMFLIFLRVMSFNTRLVLSLQPVPIQLSQDKKSKIVNKKLDDDEPDGGTSTQENKSCKNVSKEPHQMKSTSKQKKSKKTSQTVASSDIRKKKTKCKYFKNKINSEDHTATIIKSKVDDDNASVKECKTISSKLSTKLKQSTSENSDSDNIVVSHTQLATKLRPKPAGRMPKVCEQGEENSDESGYEDFYIPNEEMDSDFSDEEPLIKLSGKRQVQKTKVKKRKSQDSLEWSSGSDFEDSCNQLISDRTTRKVKGKSRKKDTKIVSKHESLSDVTCDLDSWIEVYLPSEKRWICVDCVRSILDKPRDMENTISQPLHYIFAFSTDLSVKDVTCRYASEWMTQTRKLRVDADWLNKMLKPYKSSDIELENEDDENMKDELLSKPLPKSVGEFKNHPLYVLKRHLLKFEALYPNSAVPVGYIKGEPIYARECVHTLHSRENWLKEGRSVKLGEDSYKMVKSRKWKVPKINPDALDLELFGFWQTEIYVPPPVIDGKIPRNAYGNLELFKDWMLPVGTVQVKLPALNRIAKKLGVDCVAAMIGWDTHHGFSHPLMDGWVVCIEHREALEAAWEEDQQIQLLREVEKRQKRALGNWKLLTRSLIIGDRLKKRFDLEKPDVNIQEFTDGKKADDVECSWPRNREQDKQESAKRQPKHFNVETL